MLIKFVYIPVLWMKHLSFSSYSGQMTGFLLIAAWKHDDSKVPLQIWHVRRAAG